MVTGLRKPAWPTRHACDDATVHLGVVVVVGAIAALDLGFGDLVCPAVGAP